MRLSASEKQEIIHLVDNSDLGVNRTLRELGIHKSTFYKWHNAYTDKGIDGLPPHQKGNRQQWNTIPQEQKNLVVELALDHPHLSSRELAYKLTDEQQVFISESSVYRILNGDSVDIDHLIPLEADQAFRRKLTRVFRAKLTTLAA